VSKRFEFRVCQVQRARVSYVNGEWQGNRPLAAQDVDASLNSCALEWDYLQTAGADGWDLAGIAQGVGNDANARVLYLRRERG
jgi:hypothetical protein